ncbi:WD-40 repeat protein [Chondrocystis sp. NIES-4102]|nr:WD-40 repeat protein [Chondrocystis sp. NIES-4102]
MNNSNLATLILNLDLKTEKNPEYPLSGNEIVVIGRSPDCQIVLDSHKYITVSRHHAEISLVDSNWVIKDLGTTNGTLVNSDRLTDSKILTSGDRITLGLKGPEFIFEAITLNPTVMVNFTAISTPVKEVTKATVPDLVVISSPIADPPKQQSKELPVESEDQPPPIEVNLPTASPELLDQAIAGKNLWNLINLTPIGEISAHETEITALAFSGDGQMLATAATDKTIKIWNVATQELIVTLPPQKMAINALAFSSDGQKLVSAGADKIVKLWQITNQTEIADFKGHKLAISAVALSGDGNTLASAGADKIVKLWNTQTKEEITSLNGHKSAIEALTFSPDGNILASGGKDKIIKLWNIETKEEITSLTGHKQGIINLNFSLDGATIASVGVNESIALWDINTKEIIISIAINNWHSLIAIASYGQILALTQAEGKIKLVQI